jgi:LCP family protein required for cell wall assembly
VNEWPAGWFREDGPGQPGGQDGAPRPASGEAEPGHVGAWPQQSPQPAGAGAWPQQSRASAWPQQPPSRSGGGGQGVRQWEPRPPTGSPRGGRRRVRPRRIIGILAALLALVLVLAIGGYFYLDSKLNRGNILVDYAGRPAAGAGTNWLITGSDSRQGLTRQQERQLATGVGIQGHRSDTILVLHIPGNGLPPVLLSLPRDSYVQIPGNGLNKLNAAYAFGGARLLAQTVQNATGLRIEHYMGIGFGGLVNVVDSIGGVHMCLPTPIRDPASGLNLKKGCQNLDGAQALGFVRTRHTFASQDLQREQNQRVFIKALLGKLTSPGTLLNPFASIPAAFGSVGSLRVDNGTHLYQLVSVAFALRGPLTTTVPIANAGLVTPAGDAVQWDPARAQELFHDLNHDQRIPKSLLSGSHLAG